MIGGGYQKDFITKRAHDLNLLDKTVFIFDYFPKTKIPEILSAATVVSSLFIDIPEMEHNSANKFFDGLAASKPIMLNYGGWQSQLLSRHGAGFLIPNNNSKLAANKIKKIIFDKKKIDEMSKMSNLLAKRFSIKKNYKKFEKIIYDLNWILKWLLWVFYARFAIGRENATLSIGEITKYTIVINVIYFFAKKC